MWRNGTVYRREHCWYNGSILGAQRCNWEKGQRNRIHQEIVLSQTSNYFSCIDIDYVSWLKKESEIISKLEDSLKEDISKYSAPHAKNDEGDEEVEVESEKHLNELIFEKPFNFYSFQLNLQNEKKDEIYKNYVIKWLMEKNKLLHKDLIRHESLTSTSIC